MKNSKAARPRRIGRFSRMRCRSVRSCRPSAARPSSRRCCGGGCGGAARGAAGGGRSSPAGSPSRRPAGRAGSGGAGATRASSSGRWRSAPSSASGRWSSASAIGDRGHVARRRGGAAAADPRGGAIVLPIVVYPVSYTLWQAVDLAMRPPEPGDGSAAAADRGATVLGVVMAVTRRDAYEPLFADYTRVIRRRRSGCDTPSVRSPPIGTDRPDHHPHLARKARRR